MTGSMAGPRYAVGCTRYHPTAALPPGGAAHVAEMLGTTTTAVKSAPQRAPARLQQAAPHAGQVTEPTEPEAQALLDRYIAAFETADAKALEQLLRKDALLELPPS